MAVRAKPGRLGKAWQTGQSPADWAKPGRLGKARQTGKAWQTEQSLADWAKPGRLSIARLAYYAQVSSYTSKIIYSIDPQI
jgi:hypothetical protein